MFITLWIPVWSYGFSNLKIVGIYTKHSRICECGVLALCFCATEKERAFDTCVVVQCASMCIKSAVKYFFKNVMLVHV